MSTNRQTIKVRSERVVLKTGNTIVRTTQATEAIDVSIEDAGGYYDSQEVEGALQELGADVAVIDTRGLQEVTEIGAITTEDTEVKALLTNNEYLTKDLSIQPSGSVATWPPFAGQKGFIFLENDVTLSLIDSSATTLILYVAQDSTGGHTLTFNTDSFGEIDVSQVTTDPNSLTLYVLVKTPSSGLSAAFDGKYRGSGKTFIT
jgi:hypothetical protein